MQSSDYTGSIDFREVRTTTWEHMAHFCRLRCAEATVVCVTLVLAIGIERRLSVCVRIRAEIVRYESAHIGFRDQVS